MKLSQAFQKINKVLFSYLELLMTKTFYLIFLIIISLSQVNYFDYLGCRRLFRQGPTFTFLLSFSLLC